MPLVSSSFDLHSVEWRRITDPDVKAFKVDFEYSLLGYDLASHRLDMLLRYGEGGHCRRHRHVAATVTLVLEGEQFLEEMLPDGRTRSIQRKKGTYALAAADAHPHDEHGGASGGTVLLSMTAGADGLLFEYFDENMQNPWTVSIREFVESWENGTVYGVGPALTLSEPESNHSEMAWTTGSNGSLRETEMKALQSRADTPNKDTDLADTNAIHSGEIYRGAIDRDASEMPPLGLRESQEVAADGRVLEFAKAQTLQTDGSSSSRFSRITGVKDRQEKKNWKIGIGFGIVIVLMLFVAGYFIMGAYTRTLPPADRSFGDLTRPSLR
jgi:hypothetical protein